MEYQITDNGNLLITADADKMEELRETLSQGYYSAESLIREYFEPNGHLYFVEPHWIGALTDSPILSDCFLRPDDSAGCDSDNARIWWFPNYQIECPWETLATAGRVLFCKA